MATRVNVDWEESAHRIGRDIETLAGPGYKHSDEVIRRYAYRPEYRNTLDFFIGELESLASSTTRTRSARSSPATVREESESSA